MVSARPRPTLDRLGVELNQIATPSLTDEASLLPGPGRLYGPHRIDLARPIRAARTTGLRARTPTGCSSCERCGQQHLAGSNSRLPYGQVSAAQERGLGG